MIQAFRDASFLQCQHIKRLFYHADQILITTGVATDGAGVRFGNVKTTRTVDNALFYAHNSLGQAAGLVVRAAQNKEGQALRRFYADARQLREFFNQRRYWWCYLAHLLEQSRNFHAAGGTGEELLLRPLHFVKGILSS